MKNAGFSMSRISNGSGIDSYLQGQKFVAPGQRLNHSMEGQGLKALKQKENTRHKKNYSESTDVVKKF